eukprot:CAMPEP_0171239252 /NCGR_PEP_ID=MMETSP0790-20130122/43883_1 /TAXON_ID=2925 /ORGANISM="Alexandrium catenella, Strain OF101" /LENGTH=249 /DNA_ID=CAMNT_0011705623 /DNA_START=64 /DNA_END=813 /DNA_ORIENTATION=-
MTSSRAVLSLSLAAYAAADGLFTATPGCHTLLHDIAAQGRSDMELAAYCRANMPPALCRDAMGSLGSQPWASDRIASTCEKWEEQWNTAAKAAPARITMDFAELQAKTDQCVKLKAQAGLCRNPKTGEPPAQASLRLDACIRWKQHTYPEQTKKIHEMVSGFYAVAMGGKQPPMRKGGKPPMKNEQVGPVVAPRVAGAGLYAGMAVAGSALAALAGAVTFTRFWRRRGETSEQCHALVDGTEMAAPTDA